MINVCHVLITEFPIDEIMSTMQHPYFTKQPELNDLSFEKEQNATTPFCNCFIHYNNYFGYVCFID